MARTPAPPGPPPRHYRPPGAPPAPPAPLPGIRLGGEPDPTPNDDAGLSAGAAVVIAIVTLLIGVVMGFFLGREFERDEASVGVLSTTSTRPEVATSRPPGDTIPQNPPAAPDAPPSTDLDPTTIGTLENPIPTGQAYVLGLYEIEVLDVDRDAAEELQEFDQFNPDPEPGNRFVIVRVAVRFTDANGVGNPAAIPFFVSDGTSEWQDVESTCGVLPDAITATGLIEQGEEATGNVCFTVPEDAVDGLLLGTEGFKGPVYFALP